MAHLCCSLPLALRRVARPDDSPELLFKNLSYYIYLFIKLESYHLPDTPSASERSEYCSFGCFQRWWLGAFERRQISRYEIGTSLCALHLALLP